LIRAVGPTLSIFGINNFSANPVYAVNAGIPAWYRFPGEQYGGGLGSAPPAVGWSATTGASSTVTSEGARVGAFSLVQGSNDKADVVLLYPGAYTITVNPVDSSSEGYELIEVYEVK
jgi:hypothetical protein